MLLIGDVNDTWVSKVLRTKGALDQPVVIYSGGGDVSAAAALVDLFLAHGNVVTIGAGEVASSALFVFAAGETRLALPSCRFLHHEATNSLSGEQRGEDFSLLGRDLEETNRWANQLLTRRTRMDWSSLGRGAGSWFGVEYATIMGLVHGTLQGMDGLFDASQARVNLAGREVDGGEDS